MNDGQLYTILRWTGGDGRKTCRESRDGRKTRDKMYFITEK
jgi:hypothetical protein